MPFEILSSLSKEDIGNRIENRVVIATKKIYSNNGFVIFACDGGFTVKGNYSADIVPGGQLLISGLVGTYGLQLQVIASSIVEQRNDKTKEAYIASFISDELPGIGLKTASKLAELYKEQVLFELLHNYSDVAKSVTGLTLVRAKECSKIIDEDEKYLQLMLNLRLLGITKNQCEIAYETFGFTVYDEILENPYILLSCKNIGFETCEKIAKTLDYDAVNLLRFEGAITSVVNEFHSTSGDTYFDLEQVKKKALSILNLDYKIHNKDLILSTYDDALERAIKDKQVVVYHFADGKCSACSFEEPDARISSRLYFNMEVGIKREIENFLKASVVTPNKDDAIKKIVEISNSLGINPDDNQLDALLMCMYQPICIITGGPGTGKTTITGILAKHFENSNIKCEYCAPTGRAAKRLSEAAGVKANTIHRLLEMSSDSDEDDGNVHFGRNRNNPIDARVVLVDEASMIDTTLFGALLSALKPNSSIILIGDPNQLPSVGAGNVLSDLLSLNKIPRVSLKYVFRQSDESSIASNSCRVLEGENLISNDSDFVIYETDSDEESIDLIKSLAQKYSEDDAVIISPTRQNLLGVSYLNSELQSMFIDTDSEGMKIRNDLIVYKNDKVMQIKNNYKTEYFDPVESSIVTGVFNGEIGVVRDLDSILNNCSIVFDGDRRVNYDKKLLADIDLAYAMTVHKAQGCEFDTVIIVLGKMNYKLSNRKLLYTAITRGKKRVIIVNSNGRLQNMISSNIVETRRTSLKDFFEILDRKIIK